MGTLEVHRKVADGSAVEAFLARSAKGNVLVQVSRPELTENRSLYRSFIEVAKRASTLRHPAILSPERLQPAPDGRLISVSAPVSGRTALDHLRSLGALPSDEVIRWGLRLCDALEFLHAHRLIHGHVSAANVYLDGNVKQPTLRLLDTAQLLFRGPTSIKIDAALLVDPEYLSPERVSGMRAGTASDVYGLGVLLTELLTRVPPFRGPTPALTKAAHLSNGVPTLPEELSHWQSIISGCLARDPSERFRVAELRDRLLGLAMQSHTNDQEDELVLSEEADFAVDMPATPPRPQVLQPGNELGNYQLGKLLGQGGMGSVFEATHTLIGRKVAVKVLRPELMRRKDQVRRFIQEAQAVNRVDHPNVVQIVDCVQTETHVYLVMELLQGQTLKALAKSNKLKLLDSLDCVRQVAEGLTEMHTAGVIHRDLKPDNVFLTNEHIIKILDFGVARIRDEVDPVARKSGAHTEVGQLVGTPTWMAPEQLVGRDVGPSTDVYALSLMLYVLLVHRFPFELGQQHVLQRVSTPAKPLGQTSVFDERIPATVQSVVMRGLSLDPAARPMMRELATVLKEVVDEAKRSATFKGRLLDLLGL
jgi:serine/threonine protein kinase